MPVGVCVALEEEVSVELLVPEIVADAVKLAVDVSLLLAVIDELAVPVTVLDDEAVFEVDAVWELEPVPVWLAVDDAVMDCVPVPVVVDVLDGVCVMVPVTAGQNNGEEGPVGMCG